MCYIRIKRLGIGVCVCLLFFILFSGQTAVASKTSATQTQSSQTGANNSSNVSVSTSSWAMVGEGIKILGGSVLAIVGSIIVIYRFVLEKRYDIESIVIFLIHKKPLPNMKYTEFLVSNISKAGEEVEKASDPNSYYLDISLIFSIPDGRKLLNNIFVKKMYFHLNGYDLVCVPKIQTQTGVKKCIFNKQNKTCKILLKWPTIKGGEDRKVQEEQKAQKDKEALNPYTAFRNPETIDMHIEWYPQVMLSPIVGFFLPKKPVIEFEKIEIEHENEIPIIGIRSKGIFEGRKKWIR